MIVDMIREDVFESPHKHIAFAVNAEGFNDAGFASLVATRYWRELTQTGGNKLGETLSKQCGDRTFHALVCHELRGSRWNFTPTFVEDCLNKLALFEDEIVAVVLMGNGPIGQMGGADVFAILGGLARSKRRVVVYTL